MTSDEIKEKLSQFSGTEHYYRHWTGMRYTEGVRAMAEICKAYWLIDAIASHQPRCRKDQMLRDMAFFFLRKTNGGWELVCERDMDDVAFRQSIEYSDFPLDEIQIWVQDNVILLPSEY